MGKRRIDKSNVVKALKEIKTEDKHNPSNTKSNQLGDEFAGAVRFVPQQVRKRNN
ncbi:hypothetical protein TpMuguga_02g00874 [Theileria parva strain Muguga]|uniref:Uncharacterized protein n=1 Tax=Theileria parva TaxID=5875 RepID=Q4N3W4_THEPA|nr:uncharacterized protein TpMuguga_02g00874 [Theileria parva strain Muguga]EAN33159.1 hypothetical protein TpMuguga_02g00874 [Theileria parva strain Muguga]|eukprot:XP_765442.1 hypothetical protein [Theileria parva strain Muguga]